MYMEGLQVRMRKVNFVYKHSATGIPNYKHIYLLLLRTHVEQQKLSRLVARADDVNLSGSIYIDVRAITLTKRGLSNLDASTTLLGLCSSAHNDLCENVPWSLGNELVRDALAGRQNRCIHGEIGLQTNGTL